jgi:nucleotide-binding universal stress UspA family protein
LLHVFSEPALASLRSLMLASPGMAERLVADASQTLLKEADDILAEHGVKADARVIVGEVMVEMLAASERADLLVVGARGANHLRALLLGGTAERLLGSCRQPVLVVKCAPRQTYRRVLVAVDFCTVSSAELELAMRIAPRAQITLFHAYDLLFEGRLRLAGVSNADIERHRTEAAQQARRKSLALIEAGVAAGASPGGVSVVVERGDASFLITKQQQELDADLIVMGHRRYSAVGYFFLGSVARRVIVDASCDVLVTAGAAA